MSSSEFPSTEDELNHLLTSPNRITERAVSDIKGELLILGAGGKMGSSLAVLARRSLALAGRSSRVIAVSRFSDNSVADYLHKNDVKTISLDLLQPGALDQLPDCHNIIYLPGMKFGSLGNHARTWAMNVHLAGLVATRFRNGRIVALSSGNVYPFSPANSNGCDESVEPAPIGEYAITCLGRERMFQWGSDTFETELAIVRLNYATDLRYGVLVDIANKVRCGIPVELSQGWFNTVWQGYANSVILGLFGKLEHDPMTINLTGPDKISVREVVDRFGQVFGIEPQFIGIEGETALLSDASSCMKLFGEPDITTEMLIEMTAHWIRKGGRLLGKPTHFETTDGKF